MPIQYPHLAGSDDALVMRMPTYNELDGAIGSHLDKAHDALETLSWRLNAIDGCAVRGSVRLDRPPTFEDLGALWSFVEDVQVDLELLSQLLERFKTTHLPMVDEHRRERQVASGVKAAA